MFDLATSQEESTSQFAIFGSELKNRGLPDGDGRDRDYVGKKRLTKKAIDNDASSLTSDFRSGKLILMFLLMILHYWVKFSFISRFAENDW